MVIHSAAMRYIIPYCAQSAGGIPFVVNLLIKNL